MDHLLRSQIPLALKETHFTNLGKKYSGKVRDVYIQPDKIIMITTDRVSAFDRVLTTLPFKGQLLTEMSIHWFKATAHIVRNHVIDHPDPNTIVAQKATPFKVEMIVRGYLTGSLYRDFYEKGIRTAYGLTLADGLKNNQRLPEPIITPTTKADEGHDRPITREAIIQSGLVSKSHYTEMEEIARALFAHGTTLAEQNNLILVDTKYEFGLDANGKIILIDEIHTQDSSRYWWKDKYQLRFKNNQPQDQLDKEWIRQWLLEKGFRGDGSIPPIPDRVKIDAMKRYIRSFKAITGQSPPLTPGDTLPRIIKNLKKVTLN